MRSFAVFGTQDDNRERSKPVVATGNPVRVLFFLNHSTSQPLNLSMPATFALILHAHLPFVRHPEHEDFLEEDWLFEALTETYLPLLRVLRKKRA